MHWLSVAMIAVLANVAEQEDTRQGPPPPTAQPQRLPSGAPPPPEDVEPPHPFPPARPPGQRSTYGFDDYLDWGSDLQGEPEPNPQQYETHWD
jgi:hypothetical protein